MVDRRLQYHLMFSSFGHGLFAAAVIAAALVLPLILALKDRSEVTPEIIAAAESWLYLQGRLWTIVPLCFLTVGLVSLRMSYRIAGPLYRFRGVFEAIERGEIPGPIMLREGDLLQTEMTVINAMLEALRTRAGQSEATAALSAIMQLQGPGTAPNTGSLGSNV